MKEKENKGITLIALVITIIVLLILAGVSIATLIGDNGLLTRASEAREETQRGEMEERVRLGYSEWQISKNVDNIPKSLDEILGKEFGSVVNNNDGTWILDGVEVSINEETGKIVVGDITNQVGQTGEKIIEEVQENYVVGNTIVKDENGNEIVVPDGFKVTNDTKKVHEGIVIEDRDENQFVWIPVGEVSDGTNTYQINLSRYTFSTDGTPTDVGNSVINSFFQEETISTGLGYGNTIAKDIEKFIESAKTNKGYYIGRYEASDSLATLNRTSSSSETNPMIIKKDGFVYNHITQPQAAELSRDMYTNNNFESDLMNSYAWDTAIVFIQTFGQSNYSRQTRLSSSLSKTGMVVDEQLHINDMAGNIFEWTTETHSYSARPNVNRGGYYVSSSINTAYRNNDSLSISYIGPYIGYRTLLYVTL